MKMEGRSDEMPRRGRDWIGLILSGSTLVVALIAFVLNFVEKSALREAYERLTRGDGAMNGEVVDASRFDKARVRGDLVLPAGEGKADGRDTEGDEADVGDADHRLSECSEAADAAYRCARLFPLGGGTTNLVVPADARMVAPDRVNERSRSKRERKR